MVFGCTGYGDVMADTKEKADADIFGEAGIEAWKAFRRSLHENRHCMDCKVDIGDDEEAPVRLRTYFSKPDTEVVGHFCKACWEKRKEIMRLQGQNV